MSPIDPFLRTRPKRWATGPEPATDLRMNDRRKGDVRRSQLLDAAERCFRENGFRGTSIARISEASGMGIGHIYHYFENKEAIVAGIVERDAERSVAGSRSLLASERRQGFVEACLEQADEGIAARSDTSSASLRLEILAEAARNPEVLATVRKAKDMAHGITRQILRRQPELSALPEEEIDARILVLHAMFDGLIIGALLNPGMNRDDTAKVLRRVVRMMLEE